MLVDTHPMDELAKIVKCKALDIAMGIGNVYQKQ